VIDLFSRMTHPERPHPSREPRPDFGAPAGESRASPRSPQIAALIVRVLQERLARGLNDPRIQGMISILAAELSPDQAEARIRVSVLPADRGRLAVSGLRSAARHLEGIVRKATRLRRVPRLVFELDESLKREAALAMALATAADEVARRDQAGVQRGAEPGPTAAETGDGGDRNGPDQD
jgi:ribosome-binding factor A